METNHTATDDQATITVNDMAKLLKLAIKTIWKWEAAGRIPRAHRLTRRTVRWERADIDLWLSVGKDMEQYHAARKATVAA